MKLVCIDLTKILINENTWEDLNSAMGMTKEEDEWLLKIHYDEKIFNYLECHAIITKLYIRRGKASFENIKKALSNYSYKEGTKELVRGLKNKGYEVAIYSSTGNILVEKVAKELEIGLYSSSNKFLFDENDYLINMETLGDDSIAKLYQVGEFARKLNIKLEEVICIGDGKSSQKLFEKTKGITFADSNLKDIAWKTFSNLAEIPSLI